jgi:ABC-type branched-subunit amino acid transport system ATPase component
VSALAWEGVGAGYATGRVLSDVSITVQPGELVAVLGANGAGKSTLLRAAAGLLACDTGTIRLGGEDATRWPADRRARRGLGLAAGIDTTFGALDVTNSLLLAAREGGYDADVGAGVKRVLSEFPELDRRRRAPVKSLSSGERQLLALAQAVLRAPKVLLIDELSRALSDDALRRCLALVRRVGEGGAAVVVVDQSVDVATALASRACVLDGGTVRFDGPPEQLRGRRDLLRPVFLAGTP